MNGSSNVIARPDPRGGAVALSWTNPVVPGFRGTQILRRQLDFPIVPPDVRTSQNIVFVDETTPAGTAGAFLDKGLKAETTYYYAVVAYDTSFRPFPTLISVMTTAPYGSSEVLYRALPEVYRAYDSRKPTLSPWLAAEDADKGQLLRFIELFGPQFDLLRSYASGMRAFSDVDSVDGALLPLHAQWIGWPTNYAAPLAVQRNEIKFAPRWFGAAGTAAGLRAAINRLVAWDVRLKEFAHNVFLSNQPEELTLRERQFANGQWQAETIVSLDAQYEGRSTALLASDGRPWIVYHARQRSSAATADRWHIWCKICDRGDWLPALRVTSDTAVNKSPAAVQRADGSVVLIWSAANPDAPGRPVPQLRLQVLSVGRSALTARAQGVTAGPFAFADGDTILVTTDTQTRSVTARREHFADIAQATAAETAALLNREIPGVDVSATPERKIAFATQAAASAARLTFPNSPGGAKIGLPATASSGANAISASLTGARAEPFALVDDDTLVITLDGDIPRSVLLRAAQTSAAQVAAAINEMFPGVASTTNGRIKLTSAQAGPSSRVSVDANLSTAAAKLGFCAPVPAQPVDETEPAAFVDGTGGLWLFWSSLRKGAWDIWYSRFDGSAWRPPKQLTRTAQADREPSVLFDPANNGRIWVFWSRKTNGLWNVFWRTTTKVNFDALADADWAEFQLSPAPNNFDNREPAAVLSGPGQVTVYYSSNRDNGWKIWSRNVTATTQDADTAITSGPFTHRAPAPLDDGGAVLRLLYRSNESISYSSNVYSGLTTVDARYSGSATADTRNAARLSRREDFSDILHYTYHVQPEKPENEAKRCYAQDTVGVFLTPDTNQADVIKRNIELIGQTITPTIPIQVRVVFIAKP